MRSLTAALIVVAAALLWRPLAAQFGISAEIGVARFGGTSRDSAGATVGPYRPTTYGLRLDRTLGRARVAVDLLYAATGVAGEGNGLAVVQYGIGTLLEIAPEGSLRVARLRAGVQARIAARPGLHLWGLDGEQRKPVGGRAAGIRQLAARPGL